MNEPAMTPPPTGHDHEELARNRRERPEGNPSDRAAGVETVSRRGWRRAVRTAFLACAGLGVVTMIALVIAVYGFSYPMDKLDIDAGGPLLVTDRNGTLLRSVPSPDGRPGRQSWVRLEDMPAAVVLVVIQSEDEDFYQHRGVDTAGIARAIWLNLRSLRMGYGGSTLTMQLVRMIHSPGQPRTLANKVKEAVLALRLERAADKRTILEHYLNRAYYGNGAYGIEAAAQRYFGKPATGLSLAEATLLAVVPRAPTAYDPLRHLGAAMRRRDYVLGLLVRRDLVSADAAERAQSQPIALAPTRPAFRAPHFVDWVLETLPPHVRAAGGVVRTTLDVELTEALAHRTAEHVAALADRDLQQAGVVVLDTRSGAILAMVGSAGYRGDAGQINVITRRRHPGSALKPFVYALAIEAGDNPASIAHDIYGATPGYQVDIRTQAEHGPVRYREALAGSFNLAAVDVLARVGVPRLMSTLRQAGVGELEGTPENYGLRLALGSAKVRLLDLAAAYGFLVRAGQVQAPVAVLEARSPGGRVWRPAVRPEQRIFSSETSWMVMDMLADAEARHRVFGQELPLDLPYPVAAKTGTARGFADTVAIAVTQELTVAAWAGNFDGSPTEGLVAMQSAAPLVRAGLLLGSRGQPLTLPARPAGVDTVELCPLSGKRPSPSCPHRKREHVRAGHAPGETCDWHRGGQRPGERLVIEYPPGPARAWAERQPRLSAL